MSFKFDFQGKKALVTGASKGIGQGIALALAENGAKVVAIARSESKLEELRKKNSNISVAVGDLTSSESTLTALLAPHQPFDILVNNAGVSQLESCLEISEEALNKQLAVNLKAPILLSKIVAKEMIKNSIHGTIVNSSSQASMRPLDQHLVYCASKAGLDMVTRCLAKELGPHGIRVNCVNPTVVMTEMGKKAWSDPTKSAAMLSQIPLGRFAEVDEVVKAVMFLLSDASPMTTGEALPVDGGFSKVVLTAFGSVEESPFHEVVKLDCALHTENSLLSAVNDAGDSKAVLVKGAGVTLENCELKRVQRNYSQNCEKLCGEHGECSLREVGTPIEHYECLCDYGYRGIHCDEEMGTKFALMYPIWLFVVFEIVLIVVAVKRFAGRKFYESPLPAQRFVDIMCSRGVKNSQTKKTR